MPTFTYQARDAGGRSVRGVLEAESSTALADRLRKMGYLVTRMDEVAAGLAGLRGLGLRRGVPGELLLMTVIQLSNLVEAGVPVVAALQTVAAQATDRPLREALESVTRALEGGATLSQALRQHPAIFPPLMGSLVAVGEASGKLDVVLTRYADLLEKDLALMRAVAGALLYPCLLLSAALILILFVVAFVVPQFAAVFAKAGIPLPLPTQILRIIGETIRHAWWALLLVGGGAVAGTLYGSRVPPIRARLDRLALRAPMVGPVIAQAATARLARTLGTLVGAGVPVLAALETTEGVVQNAVLVQELQRVRAAVEHGERIAATLAVGKVLSPDAIQMIRVGEESGRLEVLLGRVADVYEVRVTYSVKQMTTLLEPVLVVGMGVVVAFIMASLLLPMFDMVKVLQQGGIR